MTPIPMLAATAALALAGLTACGSDSSEEDAVRDALDAFTQSVADGDAEAACRVIALPKTREERECRNELAALLLLMPDAEREAAADIEFGRIEIDGDRATAEVRLPAELAPAKDDSPLTLRRRDGRWLVDEEL